MLISFLWGQKAYRIPYAWKKLTAYMVIAVLIFFLHWGITSLSDNRMVDLVSALLLVAGYSLFIARIEKSELAKLPVIGKYFHHHATPKD